MSFTLNEFGQPIGFALPDWKSPPVPHQSSLIGRYCRLARFDLDRDTASLFAAYADDVEGKNWTYLASGPFPNLVAYRDWATRICLGHDPMFFTIFDSAGDQPVGVASYLRIAPAAGSIEIGHIHFAPRLRRSPAATEAMFLMMQTAFELGYRRFEWKCDALNAASRAAAQRLGLSFEGVFRQATVYKGRNRDTAWYAAIDHDWPALQHAFQTWLAPSNFDQHGQQQIRLSDLTRPLLHQVG